VPAFFEPDAIGTKNRRRNLASNLWRWFLERVYEALQPILQIVVRIVIVLPDTKDRTIIFIPPGRDERTDGQIFIQICFGYYNAIAASNAYVL